MDAHSFYFLDVQSAQKRGQVFLKFCRQIAVAAAAIKSDPPPGRIPAGAAAITQKRRRKHFLRQH
jgi:hypothetical protein